MVSHINDIAGLGRRAFGLAAGGLLAFALLAGPVAAQSPATVVFAAASLKTALDEIDTLYTKETGKTVTVSYAASSALAKQIEQGAPADVFVSADIPWMNYVADKGLIVPASRVDLLGNELVLIAAAPTSEKVDIGPGVPLAAKVGDGKIATGDVAAVPAGKYAKAALEKLGVWKDVEPKIAGAENVRVALGLVARGEAKYGIVYATDAKSEPKVAVIGTFPETSHPPIIYPAAIVKTSTNPDVAAYFAFLKTAKAAKIFENQGFTVKVH